MPVARFVDDGHLAELVDLLDVARVVELAEQAEELPFLVVRETDLAAWAVLNNKRWAQLNGLGSGVLRDWRGGGFGLRGVASHEPQQKLALQIRSDR